MMTPNQYERCRALLQRARQAIDHLAEQRLKLDLETVRVSNIIRSLGALMLQARPENEVAA